MRFVLMVEGLIMLTSVVGLIACWKHSAASSSLFQSQRLVALCTSSCIAILPIGFYLLEPSSRASGLIAMRLYAIGAFLLLALVGCPSAIVLYFSQSERSFFWLFCASTLGSTFGTILIGLACMGVAA
jgi:hypothetical protein